MNTIEVRQYLQRYKVLSRRINRIMLRLEEIDTQIERFGAIDYSRVVVDGTSGDKTAVETALDRKTELIENLNSAVKEKYEVEKEITEFISILPEEDKARSIVYDYYINKLNLHDLSKKYRYSYEVTKNKLSKIYKRLSLITIKENIKVITKTY